MLNGKSFNRYQYALGSPEQARGAVRLLKFQGVDGLEVERRVPPDVYAALMAEAKAAALPVGGKVPTEVTPAQASDAGQTTIDYGAVEPRQGRGPRPARGRPCPCHDRADMLWVVVLHGKLLDRSALDHQLREAAMLADGG